MTRWTATHISGVRRLRRAGHAASEAASRQLMGLGTASSGVEGVAPRRGRMGGSPQNQRPFGGRETVMGIIGWIVLGLIAGAIAKAILPGDDPGGIIVTTIIGIVGALVGGFLAQVLFNRDTVGTFFDLSTWLTAIIGAIILLVLYRLVVGRRRIT